MRVSRHSAQKLCNGTAFPLVMEGHGMGKEVTLQWIRVHRDEIRAALELHGAVYFQKTELRTAEDFEEALEAAGFENMPYVGGAAPRETVRGKRILTANEAPPDQAIPFHHEMAQVPTPPAYVMFFCEVAPEVGGATQIVHSNLVYERFRALSPAFCERVQREGVQYVRVMPEQDDNTSPIGRSWKSTFQVASRDEAEATMRELGTSWEWCDGGDLKTLTRVVPAIRKDPRNGMPVFFNSMVAAWSGWNDSRNDGKKAVIVGDGTPVDGEVLESTRIAMEEDSVAIPWAQGDMLWIDNGLVLHARQPFQGPRRILASIAQGLNG